MMDHMRTMAMTVMVHRMRYSEVIDAILEIGGREVTKGEFPVMNDIQMEVTRVNRENVEERFRNSYLSQLQYYMIRVIVKIEGLPKEIDMEMFVDGQENHGGSCRKTIKQLIMEDATYVK